MSSSRVKKGVALIWTLSVTSLLIVFAVSLMLVASSNRITTFGLDRSSQLKIVAQAGMTKAIATLKDGITEEVLHTSESSILYKFAKEPSASYLSDLELETSRKIPSSIKDEHYTKSFNIYNDTPRAEAVQDVTGNEHPINGDCYVAYSEETHLDPNDNIDKYCIKIIVYAYGNGGSRRVETAYIDKNSISNYYFEKIFNNALTVLRDSKNSYDGPIKSKNNGSPYDQVQSIKIGGNVYIQGNVNGFAAASNDLKINGVLKVNRLDDSQINIANLKFYKYDHYTDINTPIPEINNIVGTKEKSFDIKGDFYNSKTLVEAAKLKKLNPLAADPDVIYETQDDILKNNHFTPVQGAGDPVAMVAVKCKPNSDSPKDEGNNPYVDFNKIVLGNDLDSHTGLRRYILNSNNAVLGADYNNESDYLKFYKVIMVDGDLSIDASKFYYDQISDNNPNDVVAEDFREMKMVNYIIISSGTVYIKGNVKMYNSSILADNVVFVTATEDMPTATNIDGDEVYDFSDLDVGSTLESLENGRVALGETVHTSWFDAEHTMPDPVGDTIHPEMNFTGALKTSSAALKTEYAAAKAGHLTQTNISLSGIGTEDSLRELISGLSEFDTLPADARGYLSNVQKAVMNEYFIRNLSQDYAKQLKFKIIDLEEQ